MSFSDGFSIKPIPFVLPIPGTASLLVSNPEGTGWVPGGIIDNAISASVYVIETIETVGNIDGNGAPEDPVKLKNNISLTSVTASFNGDGNKVTNITASNIANFTNDVRGQFTGSQYVLYDSGMGQNYLAFTGTTVGTTALILGQTTTTLQGLTSVSSSAFTGSGVNLVNLTASNITNFTNDVRAQLTAGQNINFTTGTISFTGTLPIVNGGTGLTSSGGTGNILVSDGTSYATVPVSGDVSLTSGGVATVQRIQSIPVTASVPSLNSVLQYNGTQWVPQLITTVLQSSYQTVLATENIAAGDAVYILNSNGQYPAGRKAQSNSITTCQSAIGIALAPISNNTLGTIITLGIISGVNTQGFVQGAPLFISPTTAGGITDIKPSAPNYAVQIGICIRQSNTLGEIYVSPMLATSIQNLGDVVSVGAANRDQLIYDSTTSLWTKGKPLYIANKDAGSARNYSNGEVITNAEISGTVYYPMKVQGGSNITLAANPISSLTSADYGRILWVHNVDAARTIIFPAGGNTWLTGGVNLSLPPRSMVKFIWLNVGSGATWVQSDPVVSAT